MKAGLLLNKPYDADEIVRRLFQKSLEAFKIVSGVLKGNILFMLDFCFSLYNEGRY